MQSANACPVMKHNTGDSYCSTCMEMKECQQNISFRNTDKGADGSRKKILACFREQNVQSQGERRDFFANSAPLLSGFQAKRRRMCSQILPAIFLIGSSGSGR